MITSSKLGIYAGLTTFTLVVVYSVTVYTPWSLFSYHPLFILVTLILSTEGIIGLQANNQHSNKDATLHGVLQGIAFTTMTIGFSVIYYNKDLNRKPHFTTVHGQLGCITYMYMLLQFSLGALIAYVPGLFGGATRAKRLYKYHRLSGYVLMVFLWTATLYGVSKPFVLPGSKFLWVYYASTALIFTGLLYRTRLSKLGFHSKPRIITGL